MKPPRLKEVSEDPIVGTDMSRHIMAHFCPHCDVRLDLGRKEPSWVRVCPDCDYWWCDGLYDPEYES